MVNIDEAVALVKSKGVEIAKSELQRYIAENLLKNAGASDMLKNLAGGAAGDLLKGMFGK